LGSRNAKDEIEGGAKIRRSDEAKEDRTSRKMLKQRLWKFAEIHEGPRKILMKSGEWEIRRSLRKVEEIEISLREIEKCGAVGFRSGSNGHKSDYLPPVSQN
jgi:hypothetical protein